jgi:hypothetical protein
LKETPREAGGQREEPLRRFFHDLAGPLSAVALHLETATRSASRGQDPSETLAITRQELEKAFELLERWRAVLLPEPAAREKGPRP